MKKRTFITEYSILKRYITKCASCIEAWTSGVVCVTTIGHPPIERNDRREKGKCTNNYERRPALGRTTYPWLVLLRDIAVSLTSSGVVSRGARAAQCERVTVVKHNCHLRFRLRQLFARTEPMYTHNNK
ncbi:unnamed protein product [Leptosia nina]|uniref:Uncharacterized protein n=1 Tax=Leptosia nina TaxID=320188 RepID=A0AAV1IUW2_9NEOP